MRPFYVTTPIYYVNDLPHIGHIYSTVVADTVARYRRLAGRDVRFLTGTDEHGQNIERAAEREGVAPLALADRVVSRYHVLWREFGMSHDDFVRTTEPRHRRGVEAMIAALDRAGDLYEAKHEGWYCSACESFYTEKELGAERKCPVHGTPAEWKSEENVFFRLSKYQDRLLEWYERTPAPVQPATRLNEVRSFVAAGLRDLSVSRSNLRWGIPFPNRPGQTVYVWLDALTNYVSALGFGDPGAEENGAYARYWAAPDAERLHIVGKDIVRFHAVYWPAFLMSAGLPLPDTVFAHGWWLRDDRKISKSAGNVVRPDELVAKFGPDALRYFLLREMPFGADASFSDEAFISRFNSDLANDLGNTASRVITLSRGAFDGRTPPEPCDDNPLIRLSREVLPAYRAAMDEMAFHKALEQLWRLLAEANQYLVEREPWKLVKTEGPTPKLSRILWNGLETVRLVATGLLPFLPQTAPKVLAAIGIPEPPANLDGLLWGGTPNGVPLPEPQPLFPRIDKKAYFADHVATAPPPAKESKPAKTTKAPEVPVSETTAPAAPAAEAAPASAPAAPAPAAAAPAKIAIDQFAAVQLRVAQVREAEMVPKSNKLVKLTVDLGDETRTVVAGIGKAYPPAELVGRQVIIVANLQPAKLMGVESNGMVLAADGEGGPVVLQPEKPVPNGTRIK